MRHGLAFSKQGHGYTKSKGVVMMMMMMMMNTLKRERLMIYMMNRTSDNSNKCKKLSRGFCGA